MRHTLPIALTLILSVVAAFAQDGTTAVATANTPVYIAPDTSRTPLRTAAQGTVFIVVAEEGEWTKVQFKDPQWGIRTGYVATSTLRFNRPGLTPMDLSVAPTAAEEAPPKPFAPPSAVAAPAASRPWEAANVSSWPDAYVVGRGGVTFGTRTAPLAGVEFGGQVTPMLQVYGSFDWHRDVSPKFLETVSELISEIVDFDVNYRVPAYVAMGGVKVTAPRGAVRPYGLGGIGYGRVKALVEVEGEDVTDLLEEFGFVDRDDLIFNKALFEVGGGVAVSNGNIVADISYRFRKFIDTGEPINISGLYAGIGVGF